MAELTSTIGKVGQASAAPASSEHEPQEHQETTPLTAEQVVASIPNAPDPLLSPQQDDEGAALLSDEDSGASEKPEVMSPPTLKMLVELGRVQDSIRLDGMAFEMATLNDERQELLFKKIAGLDSTGADSFVNLRRTVVAIALVSINGQSIDALPDPDPGNKKDELGKRLAIARLLQNSVVDKLYEFYNALLDRSDKKINPEQVKN